MFFYPLAYIDLWHWIVLILEIPANEKNEIVFANTNIKDILIQVHVAILDFSLLLEIKHEVVGCLLQFKCQFGRKFVL